MHAKRDFGGVLTLSLKSTLRLCARHLTLPRRSRCESARKSRVRGRRPGTSCALGAQKCSLLGDGGIRPPLITIRFQALKDALRSPKLLFSRPPYPIKRGADSDIPTTGTLRRVSKSLEGSTAVQGGSCLFVSHRSVESSEIENYCSP